MDRLLARIFIAGIALAMHLLAVYANLPEQQHEWFTTGPDGCRGPRIALEAGMFMDRIHLDPDGNLAAAEIVANAIRERGLLEP